MKHLFSLLLLALSTTYVWAQQPTPTKQPVELKAGRMQAQARPAINRPDVPPQFPGGAQAMGTFFQENVKYPEPARVKSLTGNVEVTATVQADGRLANPVVAKSISPECDAEALRVLALMPAWKSATRK
ncbi:MAG TPA: TonB family protein, partial [Hymenobacter sp.]|nr:TonB family protein [Hymenobacter sp.]